MRLDEETKKLYTKIARQNGFVGFEFKGEFINDFNFKSKAKDFNKFPFVISCSYSQESHTSPGYFVFSFDFDKDTLADQYRTIIKKHLGEKPDQKIMESKLKKTISYWTTFTDELNKHILSVLEDKIDHYISIESEIFGPKIIYRIYDLPTNDKTDLSPINEFLQVIRKYIDNKK